MTTVGIAGRTRLTAVVHRGCARPLGAAGARAELMQKIGARLKKHDWTQAEAASRCGVTQPRINVLLSGRVSRFSLDALVNIATALAAACASISTLPERFPSLSARLA